jgi:hypothetical protein
MAGPGAARRIQRSFESEIALRLLSGGIERRIDGGKKLTIDLAKGELTFTSGQETLAVAS